MLTDEFAHGLSLSILKTADRNVKKNKTWFSPQGVFNIGAA